MSNKEWAAFSAMLSLIFPATAPVDLLSGRIVAALGFVVFGTIAAVLYFKAGKRRF